MSETPGTYTTRTTTDTFRPVHHPKTGRVVARYDPERHVLRVWDGRIEAEVKLPERESR